MDWRLNIFLGVAVLGIAAIDGIKGYAIVTGTVYCDQCKDGTISLLDYHLSGVNVAVACPDIEGKLTIEQEVTTNLLGFYTMRFDGTPDLSSCLVQVLPSNGQGTNSCGAVAGPSQSLTLIFRIFGMEMYTVDPLISQPVEPMPFCFGLDLPTGPPPVLLNPPPPVDPLPPPPPRHLTPYLQTSACPYWKWAMPEYSCQWKQLHPDMKVAVVFGLIAAGTYGTDTTLFEALQGKADPYRTLLREATSALLNSFNSIYFRYHPLGVITEFNLALLGSTNHVLRTALEFKKANSGNGAITCTLTPCE